VEIRPLLLLNSLGPPKRGDQLASTAADHLRNLSRRRDL